MSIAVKPETPYHNKVSTKVQHSAVKAYRGIHLRRAQKAGLGHQGQEAHYLRIALLPPY